MKHKFFTILLLSLTFNSHNSFSKESEDEVVQANQCGYSFDNEQLNVLKRASVYGKPFGFEYTLPAIAWQESQAGRYLINVSDPSFGVFHVLLKTAARRGDVRGEMNKNFLAQRLVMDFELSASFAIKELLFWKDRFGPQWRKIWAAYNGGYNYRSVAAQGYAQDIANKIRYLKRCNIINNEYSDNSKNITKKISQKKTNNSDISNSSSKSYVLSKKLKQLGWEIPKKNFDSSKKDDLYFFKDFKRFLVKNEVVDQLYARTKGKFINLSKDKKNKKTFALFLDPKCPHCLSFLKELKAQPGFYDKFKVYVIPVFRKNQNRDITAFFYINMEKYLKKGIEDVDSLVKDFNDYKKNKNIIPKDKINDVIRNTDMLTLLNNFSGGNKNSFYTPSILAKGKNYERIFINGKPSFQFIKNMDNIFDDLGEKPKPLNKKREVMNEEDLFKETEKMHKKD